MTSRRAGWTVGLLLATAGAAVAEDRYASWAELAAAEREGEDFRVEARAGRTGLLVMAPHGGGIEPGTSELARALAGDAHALYLFEGLKRGGNAILHLTSTRFDEPRCEELLGQARVVVALHGCAGREPLANVGGADRRLRARVVASLQEAGFPATNEPPAGLAGEHPRNVCNRGRSGQGLQLELSYALRATLFEGMDSAGRQRPTEAFGRFIAALQRALDLK